MGDVGGKAVLIFDPSTLLRTWFLVHRQSSIVKIAEKTQWRTSF